MNPVLLVVSATFVAIAALLHVYIFTLESLNWLKPATRKIFGVRSQADAETIRPMAYNQGFYNLFLAIEAGLGVILLGVSTTVAITLILVGVGSMLFAALVLLLSSKTSRRAALTQGVPPLLGLVFLLLSAVAG